MDKNLYNNLIFGVFVAKVAESGIAAVSNLQENCCPHGLLGSNPSLGALFG